MGSTLAASRAFCPNTYLTASVCIAAKRLRHIVSKRHYSKIDKFDFMMMIRMWVWASFVLQLVFVVFKIY